MISFKFYVVLVSRGVVFVREVGVLFSFVLFY